MTTEVVVRHQPGASIAQSVPDGWHLVSDAGELVGRSADTLRKYRRDQIFVPSGYMMAGTLKCYLYSDEDIKALKELIPKIKPGRKPIEEPA